MWMMKEHEELKNQAEEARAAYRAGVISREKAIEIITPYLAVANQYAVDLAKKYGQRPRKIGMLSYLR